MRATEEFALLGRTLAVLVPSTEPRRRERGDGERDREAEPGTVRAWNHRDDFGLMQHLGAEIIAGAAPADRDPAASGSEGR